MDPTLHEEVVALIQKEVPEVLEAKLNSLFWRLIRWLGIPLLLLFVNAVVVYVLVDRHMEDGHPARVERIVNGEKSRIDKLETELNVWRSAGLPLVLIELRTNQLNILKELEAIKRGVVSN